MQIISREFLDSFGVKPGQELVLYSVADRKVYFFHRDETDFRLKLVRGKRQFPLVKDMNPLYQSTFPINR